ncbi:2-amino-4-hydroxy-6-hydroxymethyldihydropteridine diphosphokinase [Aureimonas populi]|uniref:2-amino-4-hydroxy-6-hydroxymethyldihydropteridine pyrophosphokinase n=1 Tax=Aureimonas populi TaxID=1701758 RepID=A0ABW5CQE4_9HYPH|nr:2-amino-4-hydroxy-6-hydroxymethyldihydropteridine diphosphokinase [Aureimonas populi]
MTLSYLGLGGNLGDPAAAMSAALQALDSQAGTRVVSVSRLYSTPPWGMLDQPSFLNACASLETSLEAEALLRLCLRVEKDLKRERRERWGPRIIDIDILDHGGIVRNGAALTLPHPRLTERAFVLVPLAEIAPALTIRGRPIEAWARQADLSGIAPASVDGEWWRG